MIQPYSIDELIERARFFKIPEATTKIAIEEYERIHLQSNEEQRCIPAYKAAITLLYQNTGGEQNEI